MALSGLLFTPIAMQTSPQLVDLAPEHISFLNELRESGVTNMFGAAPYLREEFPELTVREASSIVMQWMQSF